MNQIQVSPTKIDEMLVRCGLKPQAEAKQMLEKARKLIALGSERCTGRTTRRIMEALVLLEETPKLQVRFVATTTRMAQHMTNEAIRYMQKIGMDTSRVLHPRSTEQHELSQTQSAICMTIYDHYL